MAVPQGKLTGKLDARFTRLRSPGSRRVSAADLSRTTSRLGLPSSERDTGRPRLASASSGTVDRLLGPGHTRREVRELPLRSTLGSSETPVSGLEFGGQLLFRDAHRDVANGFVAVLKRAGQRVRDRRDIVLRDARVRDDGLIPHLLGARHSGRAPGVARLPHVTDFRRAPRGRSSRDTGHRRPRPRPEAWEALRGRPCRLER